MALKQVIKTGDTLTGIAAKNNTTVNNLLRLNPNITDPNKIIAGTEIVIKEDGGSSGGEKVNYNYNGTPTATPTLSEAPTLPTYNNTATALPTTNTTSWDDTEKGSAALGAMNDAQSAYDNYGDFTFSQQGWLDEILENIKTYGDFSYDLNGDALYQQYKDKYIQQGKLAMMDTMGQAAAMNGGYGSSYAQSVGQQAYQASLDNLNDIVPELYQMALDKYNMGKQDLYNQYGMLSSERQNEYGIYQDGYNKLLDALGIATDNYYNGADMYHTEQNMQNAELWNQYYASEEARQYANSLLTQDYQNRFGAWEAENENLWNQYYADEDARRYGNEEYWKNEDMEYKRERDAVGDEQWQKEYDAVYGSSGGSSGGGGSSSGGSGSGSGSGSGGSGSTGTGSTNTSGAPKKVVDAVQNYTTIEGQANYLAKLESAGVITPEQSDALLDQYGVVPLTERSWEMVDDGGINWLWGVDNNAVVRDENGNQYTLKELKKELEKTMSSKEAKAYIKELQKKLGI